MLFCKPRNESPCRKGGPSRSRAYPLRPIDTGTIPFCGGPSAKPDCKHKHYELVYVKHYDISIVTQPFVCVLQNPIFIMFRLFFAPTGPSFCRPYQPRWRPTVQDMRYMFRLFSGNRRLCGRGQNFVIFLLDNNKQICPIIMVDGCA